MWLLGAFFAIFLLSFSCSPTPKGGKTRDEVEEAVALFASKVLYNTDIKTCKEVLSSYVYFKPFMNVENGYRLTKEQVELLCTELSAKPRNIQNLKEIKVSISEVAPKTSIATVQFIRTDGEVILQQGILLKEINERYYILW
ncbi:MAG: hypothetical protein QW196_03505 [Sulfolobales archaeon]